MGNKVNDHPRGRVDWNRPSAFRARLDAPWVSEFVWLATTMFCALLAAAWVLQLWKAKLHVPFVPDGDGLLNLSVLKGLIQHGWYFTNSSVGAPLGQELYDYSAFDGDNLQFLLLRILAFGTSDPAALLNVYYVLGYPLVAGVTYLVLRALGIARSTSLIGGLLFSLLPYHFARGEGHLFLGAYFAVPAGGWLVLRSLMGEPALTTRSGVKGWGRWLTWMSAATAAAVVVAGASTLYYAVFTIMLLGTAALIRFVATRSWRAALPGIVVAGAVGVVVLVNISPGIIYQSIHGHDTVIAERQPVESEIYSLSLTQLVLPIQGHRIPAFARAYEEHQASTPVRSEGGMQMGMLFALSFLGLLGLLAVRALRGETRPTGRSALAGATALGAVIAFFYGTFGGFSSLIAYNVSPQIRAWNRLTPFIAFFALVGLVLVIDSIRDRLLAHPTGRFLAPLLIATVGVIGVMDQTSKTFLPAYETVRNGWRSDARFVAALEDRLPQNAMILQLPFHAFPETTGTNKMADYDLFKGYVHSDDLRWSYGAMKGREQDWGEEAALQPLSFVIPAAMAEGFVGVYVDRAAYADNGRAIERQLRRSMGVRAPVVTSSDGRLAFYDGRRLAERLRNNLTNSERRDLGDALVDPIEMRFDTGFYGEEQDGGQSFRWAATDAQLRLENHDPERRRMVLSATARVGAPGTVRIQIPGQPVKMIRFATGPRRLRLPFVVPPGTSRITLHADVPRQGGKADVRDLRIQLFSIRLSESLALPAAARSMLPSP